MHPRYFDVFIVFAGGCSFGGWCDMIWWHDQVWSCNGNIPGGDRQGIEVKPSGRLPSDIVNPFGSLTEGIPALVIACQTRSVMKRCRWVVPGLCLHEKASLRRCIDVPCPVPCRAEGRPLRTASLLLNHQEWTGRLACVHWSSESETLHIWVTAERKRLSSSTSCGCSQQGDVLKTYWPLDRDGARYIPWR